MGTKRTIYKAHQLSLDAPRSQKSRDQDRIDNESVSRPRWSLPTSLGQGIVMGLATSPF